MCSQTLRYSTLRGQIAAALLGSSGAGVARVQAAAALLTDVDLTQLPAAARGPLDRARTLAGRAEADEGDLRFLRRVLRTTESGPDFILQRVSTVPPLHQRPHGLEDLGSLERRAELAIQALTGLSSQHVDRSQLSEVVAAWALAGEVADERSWREALSPAVARSEETERFMLAVAGGGSRHTPRARVRRAPMLRQRRMPQSGQHSWLAFPCPQRGPWRGCCEALRRPPPCA